ncbi:MAG: zinc-binding dehydrogenase [Chloroflexota bacterium]|nr:zinc-binding dehydrogenase [Chloroflexota bacterium]
MKAVRIYARGGVDVLRYEDIATPSPGTGEVLIAVATAGVNYSDLGQRRGDYPNLVPLPTTLGNEVAGTIVGRGSDVDGPADGTRVVALVNGGYAEYAVAPAALAVAIPDGVSFAQATVIPIQGQTAYLLLERATRLQAGERVLVHAAAGGVGSLAVQLARLLGAGCVIGSSTSPDKAAYIRELGADAAVNTNEPNWVEGVMRATRGQGVDIVLDPIGGPLGPPNVACLAPFGRMVVFGTLSGAVTPLISQMLIPKCLSVSGYNTMIQPPADQLRASHALLDLIAAGKLHVTLNHSYPLAEATAAHAAIEARQTHGKVVLTVGAAQ